VALAVETALAGLPQEQLADNHHALAAEAALAGLPQEQLADNHHALVAQAAAMDRHKIHNHNAIKQKTTIINIGFIQ
jgi:hypothetical protein